MGVDLKLDELNISQATVSGTGWSLEPQFADSYAPVADVFWSSLEMPKQSVMKEEDIGLLKDVFNPKLSDRRSEGSSFIPPDTSAEYVDRLRNLLKAEEKVREKRKDLFFSPDFEPAKPGKFFPSSWSCTLDGAERAVPANATYVRFEAEEGKAAAKFFEFILKSVVPTFCRSTEDGAVFRIYQVAGLEVRTVQEDNTEELVGIVFSLKGTKAHGKENVNPNDQVVKVTEYVESAFRKGKHYNYYLYIETEGGKAIVSETLENGAMTWDELSEKDALIRNSKAKVTKAENLRKANLSVAAMKEMYLKKRQVQVEIL